MIMHNYKTIENTKVYDRREVLNLNTDILVHSNRQNIILEQIAAAV